MSSLTLISPTHHPVPIPKAKPQPLPSKDLTLPKDSYTPLPPKPVWQVWLYMPLEMLYGLYQDFAQITKSAAWWLKLPLAIAKDATANGLGNWIDKTGHRAIAAIQVYLLAATMMTLFLSRTPLLLLGPVLPSLQKMIGQPKTTRLTQQLQRYWDFIDQLIDRLGEKRAKLDTLFFDTPASVE